LWVVLVAVFAGVQGCKTTQSAAAAPAGNGSTADPSTALHPDSIPSEINYESVSDKAMSRAMQFARDVLGSDGDDKDRFFGDLVMVFPGICQLIEGQLEFDEEGQIPLELVTMGPDGPQSITGTVLMSEGNTRKLQAYLRSMLAADGGFNVRALTGEELLAWSYKAGPNISEPIYVVEPIDRQHALLVVVIDGAVSVIDALSY